MARRRPARRRPGDRGRALRAAEDLRGAQRRQARRRLDRERHPSGLRPIVSTIARSPSSRRKAEDAPSARCASKARAASSSERGACRGRARGEAELPRRRPPRDRGAAKADSRGSTAVARAARGELGAHGELLQVVELRRSHDSSTASAPTMMEPGSRAEPSPRAPRANARGAMARDDGLVDVRAAERSANITRSPIAPGAPLDASASSPMLAVPVSVTRARPSRRAPRAPRTPRTRPTNSPRGEPCTRPAPYARVAASPFLANPGLGDSARRQSRSIVRLNSYAAEDLAWALRHETLTVAANEREKKMRVGVGRWLVVDGLDVPRGCAGSRALRRRRAPRPRCSVRRRRREGPR